MLQRNFGGSPSSGAKTVVWLHLNIPIIHFGFIEILHDPKSNEPKIFQDEKTKQPTWRFHLQLFWIVTFCSWKCLEQTKPCDSTPPSPPKNKINKKKENTTNTQTASEFIPSSDELRLRLAPWSKVPSSWSYRRHWRPRLLPRRRKGEDGLLKLKKTYWR